jgi:AcrR family transcriptional regulator
MSPARSAPPPEPDRDTEERILDAAHHVFVRQGTAGARMQEIAREAGVNHAMLHYYFRSKERLAETVFRRAASEFFPSLLAVLAADEPLDAKVERVVALELEMLARRPYLPGYLIAELTHHPDRAEQLIAMATGGTAAQLRERVLRVLERQIAERVQAGRCARWRRAVPREPYRPVRLPVRRAAMVRAVLGLDDAGFDAFIAERRAALPAFILAGLRP